MSSQSSKRSVINHDLLKDVQGKVLTFSEALSRLRLLKKAKFSETLDVVISIKKNARMKAKSKTMDTLKGSLNLPAGSGKTYKVVAIVATQAEADQAIAAGAFRAGGESLVKEILDQSESLNFDYCVTTPSAMSLVARAARLLSPKNLMPSLKNGTVSNDIISLVSNFKSGGTVSYRSERTGGSLHFRVGPMSFTDEQLTSNFRAIIKHILTEKESQAIQSVHIKTTMSPSLLVQVQ